MKRKIVSLVGIMSLLLAAAIIFTGCVHKTSCMKEGETSLLIEGKAYPVYYSVRYVNIDDGKAYYQWYNYDITFKNAPYYLWITEGMDFPGTATHIELHGWNFEHIMSASFSPTGNYCFQYGAISERGLKEFPFPPAVAKTVKPLEEIGTGAFLGEEAANQLLEMGNSIIKQLKP